MEYAIAIFVGIWVAGAGLAAYFRLVKDFKGINPSQNNQKEEQK